MRTQYASGLGAHREDRKPRERPVLLKGLKTVADSENRLNVSLAVNPQLLA